ncbi:MAG: Uma2 family endonuclease, partial [Chloroflexota bacterium]
MVLQKSGYISEKEYLALDADSDIRYEYRTGEIFAMAGASREHNIITSNVHISLGTQLRDRNCEIYQSDMRVQTADAPTYRYPDIVVVCGEPTFADTKPVSLTNPTLIIEILSASTADEDYALKASEYRHISSVQEVVLIAQDTPRIERYLRRDATNWLYTDLNGLDKELRLESVACALDFSEVFRRIDFAGDED